MVARALAELLPDYNEEADEQEEEIDNVAEEEGKEAGESFKMSRPVSVLARLPARGTLTSRKGEKGYLRPTTMMLRPGSSFTGLVVRVVKILGKNGPLTKLSVADPFGTVEVSVQQSKNSLEFMVKAGATLSLSGKVISHLGTVQGLVQSSKALAAETSFSTYLDRSWFSSSHVYASHPNAVSRLLSYMT